MKKFLILATFIFFSGMCFSQSLSRNEFITLAYKIDSFISQRDYLYDSKRTSQFIYLLINISSEGTIDKVDLSGVRTDTIYKILTEMKPAHLSNWRCLNGKGKTIVIPLFYHASDNIPDEVSQMFSGHYAKIPHKDMITEVGNTILIRWMSVISPSKPRKESAPPKVIKVIDEKTN